MIKKLKAKLDKSEFIKNLLTLMTGAGIAVLIPILSSPILTRIYSPKDFGVLAIFTTMVAIGTILATLKYESAIMLPKSKKDALNLSVLSFSISIIIIFFLFLIISLIGRSNFFEFFNAPELESYFYFILLVVFSSSIHQTFSSNLNKFKMYKYIAATKIAGTASSTGGKLFFGFNNFFSLGLVSGQALGSFATAIILAIKYFRNIFVFSDIDFKKIKEMAFKYKKFPIYDAPRAITAVLASNLHIILLLKFFGQDVVGIVAFTSTLIWVPFSVLSFSFYQVYYEKISTIDNKNTLFLTYKKVLLHLLPLPFIVFFVAMLTPPTIITFIFGNEWSELIYYLRPLSIWFSSHFIGNAISTIYTRLDKLKFLFIFNIVNILFMFLIIYMTHFFNISIINTLYFIAFSKVALYSFFCIYAFYAINKSDI